MDEPEHIAPSLCRDCGSLPAGMSRCRDCGSKRLIHHPEITQLSIAHIDCDAFFAAIEKRDNPAVQDRPVIVGGGTRGVVSTCCYIARGYGVRSAMPMFKALKLCPEAVVIRPSFEKYVEAAQAIREAMAALTPLVQPISIDEAFLDLTGTEKLHGCPPAGVLARLARQIEREVGITISVGLSHNKLLAKIASELDKPRGFALIGKAETLSLLAPKPVGTLPGVGAVQQKKLLSDGYRTLGDLQRADLAALMKRYGEHGQRLYRLARGEDSRPVNPERETKSVSGETTFNTDITERAALEDRLYAMAQKVAARAKAKGLAGRVVTLKLKTKDFRTLTRRITLAHYTNLAKLIFETGRDLLRQEVPGEAARTPYRLIGIGISDLVPAEMMDSDFLFAADHRRIGQQEAVIEVLRAKFGDDAIGTFRDKRTRSRRD